MQSYFARMLMKWLGQTCPTKPGDPGMQFTHVQIPAVAVIAYSSLHTGEGNGTPLQSSCLENLMDGGAW